MTPANIELIYQAILTTDVNNLLELYKNKQQDKLVYALKQSFSEVYGLIYDQLLLRSKLEKKVPQFAVSGCWVTTRSLEQSSSQATATFKSSLISGNALLDLCGGLGVDDWMFAHRFTQVVSLDIDPVLNTLVKRNLTLLGKQNVERITADAESFIKTCTQSFDLIYVDADRRPGDGARRYDIKQTSPDIFRIWSDMERCSDELLLKLSPMFDIHEAILHIPNVHDVYVVSVKNEVKELLVHVHFKKPLKQDEVRIHAVDVDQNGQVVNEFSANYLFEKYNSYGFEKGDCGYFYEPALALIKSGLAQGYMRQQAVKAIGPNTLYGVSANLITTFFGRVFKLLLLEPFSQKEVKNHLNNLGITTGHIATRNFPINAVELRKKLKLQDGGDAYLFFMQDEARNKLFALAEKVN